jgi:hypothetical protein
MRITTVLALAALALVCASSAFAYRNPTPRERSQIIAAIRKEVYGSPTRRCLRVSLADQSFARAFISAPNVEGATALLHKKYGTWRLTSYGSSGVGCDGKAPKAVRVDLELTCLFGK